MSFDGRCSFCNHPSAPFRGGGEFEGVHVSGNFCRREHFEKWLRWKAVLISAGRKPAPFTEPVLNEAQAVLPV